MANAAPRDHCVAMPYTALTTGRVSQEGAAYLVTTATASRSPLFRDHASSLVVVRALYAMERRGDCALLAWVLMPDHLHVLLVLHGLGLSTLVRSLKGRTARTLNAMRAARCRVWQAGFHDRAVRREEDLVEIARYIVANPLRAGLVDRIGEYPYWNAVWLQV